MSENNEERIITTAGGRMVANITMKDHVPDGACEWYDPGGNLIVYGYFKKGIPFAGTFLNWAGFSPEISKDKPYDPAVYCRDWITLFEAGYDSEIPDYTNLIEVYSSGKKIEK